MNIKLSTAQAVALHTIESVVFSAIITVLSGLVQYVSTHGLNLQQLGVVAGASFLGAVAMLYKSLSTNPQVIAGLTDTVSQTFVSVQNIEQALIPGVTPRATTASSKAQAATWKPVVNGPNTIDHAG